MNTNTPLNVPYTTLKIAIAIAMYSHSSLAVAEDQPTTRLDAIVVESSNDDDNPLSITKAPLTDKITDKKIKEELIRDNRDLVRYNPEVSIGEVGRYGAKGFNIQGVDGNRVAMLVDGVRVPEVETNEFFSPYGYMNESRFMADVETLQSVEINKGADSLNSGSGAVGGAVMYKSREPDDLIKKGQSVGGYVKSGYTSKNEEWLHAVGVAGKLDKASGLLNYARREGHELKNHDMRSFDSQRLVVGYQFPDDEFGGKRTDGGREKSYLYPDPTHYVQDSTLIKFYYQPTEQHKFGVHGSYQYMINQNRSISKDTITGKRFGFDENERKAHGISYEYTPNASDWLDNIKFDHTIQRIVIVGDTFVLGPSSNSDWTDWTRTYRPNYFDTKQFSLQANTLNLLPPENKEWLGEHQFHSGLEYAKQYYDPYNINYSSGSYSEFNSTMLLPMKSDVYSAYLKDNIYFNDKFQIDAGLRYDQHNRQIVNIRDAYLRALRNPNNVKSAIIDAYQNGSLTAPQKKDAWTWQTTFRYLPKNNLQFDYQIGTGFLMPLAMQSYSGFAQNGVEQVPNPSLKPETSLNQQISVQKSWDNGLVKLTAYHNKYQDFIDSEEYGSNTLNNNFIPAVNQNCNFDSCFVYLNRDSAVSKGVALSANYRLPYQKYGTFDMRGQVAYQQGEANDGTSLLAIQPLNGLIGLRYQPNSERFSMNAVANYIGKKDADQTKRRLNGGSLDVLRIGKTAQLTTDDFSKKTWVYDVYGNLKLTDNFSLQAGVYNLTNEKYMPWDSVRTLALLGVNTMVDDEAKGLNRYTAPGRNFAISLNYEF